MLRLPLQLNIHFIVENKQCIDGKKYFLWIVCFYKFHSYPTGFLGFSSLISFSLICLPDLFFFFFVVVSLLLLMLQLFRFPANELVTKYYSLYELLRIKYISHDLTILSSCLLTPPDLPFLLYPLNSVSFLKNTQMHIISSPVLWRCIILYRVVSLLRAMILKRMESFLTPFINCQKLISQELNSVLTSPPCPC